MEPFRGLPRHQHAIDHRLDRPEPVNLAHRHGDRPGCRHASLPSKVSQHGMRRFSFAQVRHYSFAVTHQMLIIYLMSNQTSKPKPPHLRHQLLSTCPPSVITINHLRHAYGATTLASALGNRQPATERELACFARNRPPSSASITQQEVPQLRIDFMS